MSTPQKLQAELRGLHRLARVQRSARMGLRAVWLGGAGVLLGWGINALTGWLPNPLTWVGAGMLLALAQIALLVRSLSPDTRWVRRMDSILNLREQVSTAWEVAGGPQGRARRPGNRLSAALVRDVLGELPQVRERMMTRGWYLKIDLIAAVIVLLLGLIVLSSNLLRPYAALLGDPPQVALDPLPEQPQPFNQPPQQGQAAPQPNQPGQQPGGEEGEGREQPSQEGEPQPGSDQPASSDTSMDREAIAEALRELGSQLREQAGTFELGEALENMDLNEAAEALEDLNGQLDELSPESRENLAEALGEAAEELEQAGEPSLPENMREAAEELLDDLPEEESEALSEMASDLRDLAQQMDPSQQAGGGSGQGEGGSTGRPEPLTRFDEESGAMDIPLEDTEQSGLLNPAPPDGEGEGTASGSQDATGRGSADAGQSPLVPNTFSWKWRDVVSQFFDR